MVKQHLGIMLKTEVPPTSRASKRHFTLASPVRMVGNDRNRLEGSLDQNKKVSHSSIYCMAPDRLYWWFTSTPPHDKSCLSGFSSQFTSICNYNRWKYEPPHDKTKKMTIRLAKTGQPGHLPSLIRIFAVRIKNIGSSVIHWAHCEDWSDWADAQADLSLRWEQSFCCFCHEVAHIKIV